MNTTSDARKLIKSQAKYMIDNQYYATLSIFKEQHEMFRNKRATNDDTEISEFFEFQIDGNTEVMGYLFELRESLTEAVDTPSELPCILNRLDDEASKGCNEWILDTFSDVIEYLEQLSRSSLVDHPDCIGDDGINVLNAA